MGNVYFNGDVGMDDVLFFVEEVIGIKGRIIGNYLKVRKKYSIMAILEYIKK